MFGLELNKYEKFSFTWSCGDFHLQNNKLGSDSDIEAAFDDIYRNLSQSIGYGSSLFG